MSRKVSVRKEVRVTVIEVHHIASLLSGRFIKPWGKWGRY